MKVLRVRSPLRLRYRFELIASAVLFVVSLSSLVADPIAIEAAPSLPPLRVVHPPPISTQRRSSHLHHRARRVTPNPHYRLRCAASHLHHNVRHSPSTSQMATFNGDPLAVSTAILPHYQAANDRPPLMVWKMTSVEKLLLQIFEKNKLIIEQVKKQSDLFDQHLASKCILDGISPPPWLLSTSFSSVSSDSNAAKKEELISELLLTRSQPASIYPSSHHAFHEKPSAPLSNEVPPNYLEGDGRDVNKATNTVDRSALSNLPITDSPCALNQVLEQDSSVTSPQECRDTQGPDNCADHSQSFVMIERSKSRQRALEARSNSILAKRKANDENDPCVWTSQNKSVSAKSKLKVTESLKKGQNDDNYNCGTGLGTACLSSSPMNELFSVSKSSDIAKVDGLTDANGKLMEQSYYANPISATANPTTTSDAVCAAEEANGGAGSINAVGSFFHSARATNSRRSSIRTGLVKETSEVVTCIHNVAEDCRSGQSTEKSSKDAHNENSLHGLIKPSYLISNQSHAHPNLQVTGVRSIGMGSDGDRVRVTGSMRSSCCHHNNEGMQLDFHDDCDRNQVPCHANILTDLIKATMEEPGSQIFKTGDDNMGLHKPTQSVSTNLQNDNVYGGSIEIDVSSNIAEEADIAVADSNRLLQKLQSASIVGQEVCLLEPLGTHPSSLPCTESPSLADVETCGAVPAETVLRSPGPVAPDSVTSKSNSNANTGFTSRSRSEDAMVMEPNQLHFDDMEPNRASDFDGQDKDGSLSMKQSSTVRFSTGLVTEVASVSDQEHHNLLPDTVEGIHSQEQPRKDSLQDLVYDSIKSVDASNIKFVQDQKNVVASQNPCGYSPVVGSWPQYKRIKIADRSSYACRTPSSLTTLPLPPFLKQNEAMGSNHCTPVVEEIHEYADNHKVKPSEVLPSTLQVREDENTLGRRDRSENSTVTFTHEQLEAPSVSSLTKLATGSFEGPLSGHAKVWDPSKNFEMRTSDESQVSSQVSDEFYLGSTFLTRTENIMQTENSDLGENRRPSDCPVVSPLHVDLIALNQNMVELEKFFVETDDSVSCATRNGTGFGTLDFPNNALDHASVLEQFHKSTCLQTPLSSFPDNCNLQNTFGLEQTIPNVFLGSLDLKGHLVEDAETTNQFEARGHCLSEEPQCASHEISHPYCLPSPNAHFHQESSKPYMSPLGRFWDGIPQKSRSSEKRASSIPDLPSIKEETENMDGIADSMHDDIIREKAIMNAERKPLAELTEYANRPMSVCEDERLEDRDSLASVSTEFSLASTCKMANLKPGNRMSTRSRFADASNGKVNPYVRLGSDGVRRHDGSLQNRISKSKLSSKNESRKASSGVLGKEPKCNNIVSNITSFVPLVQQKQMAAAITGKRDVKVKALEAAEAAKQLAEKKENDRRLKKEALKLERARIEEQNLRQLELEKERKEQERKKKEAEMAAKKRQREEEQKKDRERKKKRVEETRRQNMEHREKRNGNKEEMKPGATEVNACKTKDSKEKSAEHPRIGKTKPGSRVPRETETKHIDTHLPAIGTKSPSIAPEAFDAMSNSGDKSKAIDEVCERKEKDSLISDIVREESYTISPYKGSDNEDEYEDDNKLNTKFVPSWARKRSISLAILAQQKIDPESIFQRGSFCSREKEQSFPLFIQYSLLFTLSTQFLFSLNPSKSLTLTADQDSMLPSASFLLLFLFITSSAAGAPNFTFDFDFPSLAVRNLTLLGDSYFRDGVVGLTRDVTVPTSSSGSVIYNIPIPFSDSDSPPSVPSFSSRFTFSVDNVNPSSFGDGLAFFLSRDNQTMGSPGGYLGLVNASLLTKNKFVAVEFDTRLDAHFGDPNENHVGLDIDSLISVKTADPLTQGIDLKSGDPITAWVDYDGDLNNSTAAPVLQVFLSYSASKPQVPLLSVDVDLSDYLKGDMYVGFSGSTDGSTELHSIHNWSFNMTREGLSPSSFRPRSTIPHNVSDSSIIIISPDIPSSSNPKNKNHKKLGLGFGIAGPSFFCACLVVFGYISAKKLQRMRSSSAGKAELVTGRPKEFNYRELSSATRGFHASRIIGKGAFGNVYKAFFVSTGTIAAVKRSKHSHEGKTEFLAELSIIAGLRHKNLVQLLGWCVEKGELLLVYEFMPHSSLDKVLHHHQDSSFSSGSLSWSQRRNVAVGLASALTYLHEECEQQVIHRDIKSSNVMLDMNYNARLGDFGLARVMEHDKSPVSTLTAGTMGYLAPEYLHYGKATEKTDVFSYGVVLLEVACGRRPIERESESQKMVNLVDWVWGLYGEGKVLEAADERLNGEFDGEEMRKMLMVGLSCANPDSGERPTMRKVLQILNGEVEVKALAKSKPTLTFSCGLSLSLEDITSDCEY
ncbi:Probable L-type lectin-domain containing receptor kinase S.7 [Linum grandiflorum]